MTTTKPPQTSPTPRDPYEHAEQLGITVIHRPIRTATGFWIPDHNLIVLRTGMRRVHDRSTLAHELAHAALGHVESTPKTEHQADRLAARNMIDPAAWLAACKWCDSLPAVAAELGVSTKLARAFAESGAA